jgi:general secretion pathway protein K
MDVKAPIDTGNQSPNQSPNQSQRRKQNGMALIAVLWITAALSLLAMSLSQMARTDIRVVTVFKQNIQAQALADGALTVAADWLQGQVGRIQGVEQLKVGVGGQEVNVQIVPAAGFININMAPQNLLRDLFIYGAGLSTDRAIELAKNVVAWRSQSVDQQSDETMGKNPPRHDVFVTPQDIRQVAGVTPDIYARIAPLIVANPMATVSSLVDPNAAPAGVLSVLAGGDKSIVQRIIGGRADQGAQAPPVNVSGLNPEYLQTVGSSYFRLTARVDDSGNMVWKRTWWVDYSMQRQSVTPWFIAQIEPLRSAGRE